MKKIFSIVAAFCLLFSAFSQQTIYYDFYPNNANPPGNYIISLQTGDKTPGGTPYNFWTLNQMIAWLALRGITNATIFQVTSNVSVTTITTNLILMAPGGFTNLTLTPNTLMYANINQVESSVPNGQGAITNNGSGTFGWFQFYLTKLNDFGTNMNFSGVTTFSGTNNSVVAAPGTIYYGDGTGLSNVTATAANKIAATNVFSGGTLPTNTLSATAGLNGWFLGQSNATPVYTQNGGALSNLNGASIQAATVANGALANNSISITDGAGIGISGSPVSLGGTLTGSANTANPQFAGVKLTALSSAPAMLINTNNMSTVSNTLDFAKSGYTVVSLTACQVTGFANLPTTNTGSILWHGVNTAGTNWNLTIPNTVLTTTGVRGSVTVTNGQNRFVWFIYDPASNTTNEVDCPNF